MPSQLFRSLAGDSPTPARGRHAMPFAWASHADLLVTPDQEPILPVADENELQILQRVASLFDVSLQQSTSKDRTQEGLRARAGTVVGLGPEAASAAALYAHLTGRSLVIVPDVETLQSLRDVAVVAAVADRIDEQLMRCLCVDEAGNRSIVPGLLIARTDRTLATVAKKSAIAVSCSSASQEADVFVFPGSSFVQTSRREGIFVSGTIETEELLRLLGSGAPVLSLNADSNGLDIPLSRSAILCPFPRTYAAAGMLKAPCVVTGRCSRFPSLPQRTELWAAKKLIPIDAMVARALVVNACNVVKLVDGVLDATHNLGAAIAEDATFGVCFTSWRGETSYGTSPVTNRLVNDLKRSAPAGEALHRFNRNPHANFYGLKFCLLGDPEFRLHGPASPELPEAEAPEQPLDAGVGHAIWDRRIVTAQLNKAIVVETSQSRVMRPSDPPELVLNAIEEFTQHVLTGSPEAIAVVDRIDKLLPAFFAGWPWLDDVLDPFGSRGPVDENLPCSVCGRPTRSYTFTFAAPGLGRRQIKRCAACRSTTSYPAHIAPVIDLTDARTGLLRITAEATHRHAVVALLGMSYRDTRIVPWPADPSGRLCPVLQIDLSQQSGPLLCYVLACHDGLLGLSGFYVAGTKASQDSLDESAG